MDLSTHQFSGDIRWFSWGGISFSLQQNLPTATVLSCLLAGLLKLIQQDELNF